MRILCVFLTMLFLCAPCAAFAEEGTAANQVTLPVVAEQKKASAIVTRTPEPTPRVFVDLTMGARGDDVRDVQARLVELGFFTTAVDGIFGQNTQLAVIAFQTYLRFAEQTEIDALLAAEAARTPFESATPVPSEMPGSGASNSETPAPDAATGEALAPTPTPAPTPIPTPVPTPTTVANGVVDAAMAEKLLESDEIFYVADVRRGEQGLNVIRLQTRLIALNYLSGAADGVAGVNTEAAILKFQSAHKLPQTGIADSDTQRALYSGAAVVSKHPVYNYLKQGSYGEDVKTLQRQLRILGFYTGAVDGSYQGKTIDAVKLLQEYLYRVEQEELASRIIFVPAKAATPSPSAVPDAGATPDVSAASDASATPSAEELHEALIASDPDTNPYEVMPEVTSDAGAKNVTQDPQAIDFVADGEADSQLQTLLYEEGIVLYRMDVQKGDQNEESLRLQRRLYTLGYLTANGVDGIVGSRTETAITSFQSRNALRETGIADRATQEILYSEAAKNLLKPYTVKVSVDDQRVYVYALDANDQYTQLVKTMVCSTGTKTNPTPLGSFTNTGRGARWHYFSEFDCWAQYAYYINGDIMFHSVLYAKQDVSTLQTGSLNNLGRRASHGCVRLSVDDAEWIYNNCSAGTTVTVY